MTLSKTIRYKLSNTDLQTKIYKVNVKNKDDIKESGVWVSKFRFRGFTTFSFNQKNYNILYE